MKWSSPKAHGAMVTGIEDSQGNLHTVEISMADMTIAGSLVGITVAPLRHHFRRRRRYRVCPPERCLVIGTDDVPYVFFTTRGTEDPCISLNWAAMGAL